jgi:hypothetical protein
MASIRDTFQKSPWLGWTFALIMFGVAAYFAFFRGKANLDPSNPDRMREMITIKFTDTGDELQMPRGRFEREIRESQPGMTIDPSKGLINPKTGQPTGVLFDKTDWDSLVKQINTERAEFRGNGPAPEPAVTKRPGSDGPRPQLPGETPKPDAPKPDAPK